jgi:hypothetical protein
MANVTDGAEKRMRTAGSADAHVTLKIPRPLYEQLKQVIQGSGFHSVTEFAVYVLRDLVSHRSRLERAGIPAAAPEEQAEPLSSDEIEAIRKRLESLGYL